MCKFTQLEFKQGQPGCKINILDHDASNMFQALRSNGKEDEIFALKDHKVTGGGEQTQKHVLIDQGDCRMLPLL